MTQRVNPIGISSHLERLSTTLIDKQLDLMKAAGIHWVRQEFQWASLEAAQGTWNFVLYDHIINGIISRGMQVIGLLSQYWTPSWYRGSNPWNTPPAPQDYALFAKAVVSHYKYKIPLYEVGNEPNQAQFWYPSPDPVAYSNLLKAAYPAIKAADSGTKVISAGLSTYAPQTYLKAMYGAGVQGYMDCVGYHPYCWPLSPDVVNNGTWFGELSAIQSIMVSSGDGSKQIIASEVGWPTSTNGNTEADQASYISRVFQKVMFENFQYVTIVCIYDFLNDGTNLSLSEDNFGILHADYTQKPSYSSMQSASSDYAANFTSL